MWKKNKRGAWEYASGNKTKTANETKFEVDFINALYKTLLEQWEASAEKCPDSYAGYGEISYSGFSDELKAEYQGKEWSKLTPVLKALIIANDSKSAVLLSGKAYRGDRGG